MADGVGVLDNLARRTVAKIQADLEVGRNVGELRGALDRRPSWFATRSSCPWSTSRPATKPVRCKLVSVVCDWMPTISMVRSLRNGRVIASCVELPPLGSRRLTG